MVREDLAVCGPERAERDAFSERDNHLIAGLSPKDHLRTGIESDGGLWGQDIGGSGVVIPGDIPGENVWGAECESETPGWDSVSASQGLTRRGDDDSDTQIQQLITPTQIPSLDQAISQSEVTSIDLDKELREHLRSLPTKNDIQLLISAVELSSKQMVDGLREDR